MTEFSYKAIRSDGTSYEDTANAPDRFALDKKLRAQNVTLVSAEPVAKKSGLKKFASFSFGGVKLREKIIFTRNLSAMISAGLSLSRSLSVLERQTKNKKFKSTLRSLNDEVQQGTTLSEALGHFPKIFPPLFVSMVRSGEESGRLSDSLTNLGVQMEKSYQLKRRIKGAMMYPSIVITAMIIVGAVLLTVVVPTLTSTFEELDVDLPASTQFVISLSNFLKENTIIAIILVIFAVTGFIYALRHPKSKPILEFIFLHIPVIGQLVKETNSAQTTRTLSSLLVSGVEVVSALSITKEVLQNTHYKKVIAQAEERIQKGAPISAAFLEHEELYPVLVGEMVSVGEEAGNLPEMLDRVATFYEGEVEERTKNLSTIIEPILMLIIGVVVGFFAVSMISPIYSISSGI